MLTDEQRAIRRQCIGSSEIAKVCGVDFWGEGPHRVYMVKRGLIKEQAPTIDTDLGDIFEEAVSKLYARKIGIELVRDPVATRVHPEHQWMAASIDWLQADQWIPVECKWIGTPMRAHYFAPAIGLRGPCADCGRVASMHWGKEPDEVPDDVRTQCAWQMAVTHAPWMHVARLWIANFNRDFAIYTVERNLRLEARLIERGRSFWHDHVLLEVPPDPDGSDSSESLERLLQGRLRAGLAQAPDAAEPWAQQWLRGDAIIGDGESIKAEAANWLRRYIRESGTEGIESKAWKATARTAVNGKCPLLVKRKKVV